MRIYWCATHCPNSIPSPVFRISQFIKISHNQPNFEIFPMKLVFLNQSCILRSHWCQNHLKMSNPSGFPKFSQFSKNEPKQPFSAVCGDFQASSQDFLHENTSTLYFTIFVPRKSQANLKTSPNWPKFQINDVIPEVVLIFRSWNTFSAIFFTQE